MTTITLNVSEFRGRFPQFANTTTFSDATIEGKFDSATGFVSDEVSGDMTEKARRQALYLMTAHLLAVGVIVAAGGYTGQPGIVTAASVGDVSTTLSAPPFGSSQWRYWLNLTPYGQELLGLLDAQSVGGFFVGGSPERAAFRKVGGWW